MGYRMDTPLMISYPMSTCLIGADCINDWEKVIITRIHTCHWKSQFALVMARPEVGR